MVATARKAIDWKPQKVVLTIPPSTEATEITIEVMPKSGRAYAEMPNDVGSRFEKPLTNRTKPEKM